MKLKTAVYYAAMFMQLDEVCKALESDDAIEGETADEIDRLTRCAGLVLGEIASDYIPLKTSEIVDTVDGTVGYADLRHRVIDVFSVTDKTGVRVKIKSYGDRFVLPAGGRYTVEYSYHPGELALDDELPYTDRVSARVIGYGIACEYCIISGMTDDAVLWDKRFKDALGFAAIQKNERRIPRRRWL